MNNWNISDEKIKEYNARILDKYPIQQRYTPEGKSACTVKDEATDDDKRSMNDEIKKLLAVVEINQYKKTLTSIGKLSGLTAGTGSRTAMVCEKQNLIKIIQVKFGRGRPKYPVLLPDGYKLLGIHKQMKKGRGAGYEHTLYQHLVMEHFFEFNTEIELNRKDKFIDVAIETNELLVCFEIAMTSVHEKNNIEKDFSLAKADYVVVACLNEKVHREVMEIIAQQPDKIRSHTKTYLIQDLLKSEPKEFISNLQTTLF